MGSMKLVWRNLMRRPMRSLLTILSLTIAVFLICGLLTLITTINAGVKNADNRRLAVMSSTGLFVELPMKYQAAIEKIPGVEMTTKFQWFGGYYRSMKNWFAQFAVDPQNLFPMYPELRTPVDQQEAFIKDKTSCIVGDGIAAEFGWKVGDTIPILSPLHPNPENKAWEFKIAGFYHPEVANFDDRTLFFHWDYFEKTIEASGATPGVGLFSIKARPDADVPSIIAQVEDTFRDSDQLVDCVTESEFQRQFVTMFGNIPLFVGWIGSGVVLAILLASVNTMLMSMREQSAEIGILKSLGFTDGSMFGLLISQAMCLCTIGGGLGILLAWVTQKSIATALAAQFPGYAITAGTFAFAGTVTLLIGFAAGIMPAWRARELRCVEALRGAD
ncbi:MAG TPA: FtsX-like permease family protein [Planctomycetota bacterium]|nr:FtsX-like permease family protein [Planctomycetota bacterium]